MAARRKNVCSLVSATMIGNSFDEKAGYTEVGVKSEVLAVDVLKAIWDKYLSKLGIAVSRSFKGFKLARLEKSYATVLSQLACQCAAMRS